MHLPTRQDGIENRDKVYSEAVSWLPKPWELEAKVWVPFVGTKAQIMYNKRDSTTKQ